MARCTLNIVQINVDRVRAAQDALDVVLRDRKIDIAIVAEPNKKMLEKRGWFTDNDKDACIIRTSRAGEITEWGHGSGFVWIGCSGVYIYSIYISPNAPEARLERFLHEVQEDARNKRGPILIAGDFNAKSHMWGSPVTDRKGALVEDWLSSMGLVTMNSGNRPTFMRGPSSSFIDITMASEDLAPRVIEWQVLDEETLSMHAYITFSITGVLTKKRDPTRRPVDMISCRRLIREEPGFGLEVVDPNAAISLVKRTIRKARSREWCDSRGNAVQWWSEELSDAKIATSAARRQLTRARGRPNRAVIMEEMLANYTEAKRAYRRLIFLAKKRRWEGLCSDLDTNPWGEGYKIATRSMGVRHPKVDLSTEKKMEIARDLFPAGTDTGPPKDTDVWDNREANVTLTEVREAARRLKPGRAAGPDGVPPEAIKMLAELHPNFVVSLMKKLYQDAHFPPCWKRAHLVLIPKPLKNPRDVQSYRPICLLDTMGKLMESIILSKLVAELERTGGLHPDQYGFRAGRSTVDALLKVLEVPRREGGRRWCVLLLLDVKNAFNTASWGWITKKLRDRGVDNHLRAVIGSYLSERIVEISTRSEIETSAGVPQGSVLGPTLWNVLYDDVLRLRVPPDCRLFAYADDLAAVIVDETEAGLTRKGNAVLASVDAWMNEHLLALAPEKTEAIVLTGMRRPRNISFTLRTTRILPQPTVRYLGVVIDRGMTFGAHVVRATEKAAKAAAALTRILPNVGGPSMGKRRIIAGAVQSIILYAAPVWHRVVKIAKYNNKLAQGQRVMALRVACAYRTVSTEAALVIAGMIPIWLLIDERRRTQEDANRKEERSATLRMWQEEWRGCPKGVWTRRLIPDLAPWIGRKHGVVDYWFTQFLTGHGCFNSYLKRIRKRDTDKCEVCDTRDDPEHVVFDCTRWAERREELCRILRTNIAVENIIPLALRKQEDWSAVRDFVKAILTDKNAE